MGGILKVLGALFLILVVGIVALLVWAHRSGSGKQEAFFTAVYSGDPAKVLALCDSSKAEEVDAPMLATWMRVFSERHGEFKGMSASGFSTSKTIVNGVGVLESEGTVEFENGSVRSKLIHHDDKIVDWEIDSEKMKDDWFEGPDETEFYRQRSKALLTHMLSGEPGQAYAMFSPPLQEACPMTKTTDIAEKATGILGALKSITFKDEKFEATEKGQFLTVLHTIECDDGVADGVVQFEFANLKGHLTKFQVIPR